MNRFKLLAILALLAIGTYVLMGSIYTVSEVEQAIITQFGEPVGAPVTTAGLKFKVPFIQDVNLIDKRVLEWDGNPSDMPTKDKLYISVDEGRKHEERMKGVSGPWTKGTGGCGVTGANPEGTKWWRGDLWRAEKVRVFGIELLDIRFKRINYNESVRPKIYDRMISERRQIAERFLSEGNGEAARNPRQSCA